MSVFFTRRGKAGARVKYVPYIQSSGGQFVDTLFKPNNNTCVVMDVEFTKAPTDHACVFGARNSNRNQFWCYYRYDTSSYVIRFANSSSSNIAVPTVATERTLITMDGNVLTVNGTSVAHTDSTFQSEYSMYLFSVNAAGSTQYLGSFKLYSCQIYDNDVLIRDFRPCYDPDGIACLYDKVEGKYYYNAGTGQFIAG